MPPTKRSRCRVPGCTNMTCSKGRYNGRPRYGNVCGKHKSQGKRKRRTLSGKCSLCGWVGPCDIHRIVFGCDGGQYRRGNMMEICPNCHRLIHSGLLCVGRGHPENPEPLIAGRKEGLLFSLDDYPQATPVAHEGIPSAL